MNDASPNPATCSRIAAASQIADRADRTAPAIEAASGRSKNAPLTPGVIVSR